VLIFLEVLFQARARTAVVGSRQRYVALSARRIASWLVNVGFIVQGVIYLAAAEQGAGWVSITIGGLSIFLEVRNHGDDDDWFNGRGAKIRRGIRKLMTATRPSGRTVPAFGMLAG
jgi:hypothetical protein